MRLTLAKKLGLGFGSIIAMIVVLAAVVFVKVNIVNRQMNTVLKQDVKTVEHALATQGEIHHALSMHRGYMILGLPSLADERINAWTKIEENVSVLETLAPAWTDPSAAESLQELQTVLRDFRQAQDQIAAIAHTPENIPSQHKFFNEAVPFGKKMEQHLDAVLALEQDLEANAERRDLVKSISAAKAHLLLASGAVTSFLVDGSDRNLKQIDVELTACQNSVDRLLTKTDLLTPAQREEFDQYIESREQFLAQAREVIAMRSADDWNVAEHICLNTVSPLAGRADELLSHVMDYGVKAEKTGSEDLFASANGLLILTLITAGAASVIGIAIALVLSRSITRNLQKIAAQTHAIAEKNLSVPKLNLNAQDELGDLSRSVDTMQDALRGIIEEVTVSSQEVASAATEIAASSDQMVMGIDQQQEKTTQVSAAVEEMSASVIEVARKSSEASGSASEAGESASQGGEVVEQTVSSINEIAEVVSEAAGAVRELGQRSEQIGEVIEVINDIADQTNLLALNAAIEAARAGEHGRGFAVVADEVRKLADRTTKATEEIAESITAIQGETGQAVQRIEQGTQRVEHGVELATRAGESLAHIVAGSGTVTEMIQSIATSADQQSTVAEQIAQDIDAINSVTSHSAEGARQAADAAAQLSRKSEQLQQLVSQFRLHG